jgi:PKD repeat protein
MMTPISGLFKAFAVVGLSLLSALSGDSSAPSAAFSPSPSNPAAGSPVRFVGAIPGDAVSWSWDFGDGGRSAARNPAHLYAAPGFYVVTLTLATPRGGATTSQLLQVSASNTLTLNTEHSFDVTLTATDQRTGRVGTGQAIPQNDHFGYFSIPDLTNDPTNPEVFVKVLDGTPINGNYWAFYGGLTDLEYTFTVKENATGNVKRYHKAPGSSGGGFDTAGFASPPNSPIEAPPCSAVVPGTTALPGAFDSNHTLTLNSAHSFDVTLTATDQRTGRVGTGLAIPQNDHFGYFSIPDLTNDPTNPEVFVKVLDGTPVNGNFWNFYGGLTDLDYTISIKENATGLVKTYHKPGGTACGGFDTSGYHAAGPTPTPTPTPTPPSGTTRIVNVGPGGAHVFKDTVSGNGTTTIHVGDTVQWVFQDTGSMHSATSGTCDNSGGYYDYTSCNPDGVFDSGTLSAGQVYSKTFTSAGSYKYFCSVHGSVMTGFLTISP